jgi:hypothetical protein
LGAQRRRQPHRCRLNWATLLTVAQVHDGLGSGG